MQSNNYNSGMTGSLFGDIKDKIFQLAEGLIELVDDTKQQWKDYFISNVLTIKYSWEQVVSQHDNLIKNREISGFPKFDDPASVQASVVTDPTQVGWTSDDENI